MKKWTAALLSLTTIAGGHLYNRRPYTALLFLFMVVALQSLINGVVPILAPLLEPGSEGATFRWMISAQNAVLILVALASAWRSFLDARAPHADENGELKVVSSISGALIG